MCLRHALFYAESDALFYLGRRQTLWETTQTLAALSAWAPKNSKATLQGTIVFVEVLAHSSFQDLFPSSPLTERGKDEVDFVIASFTFTSTCVGEMFAGI